MKKVIFFVSLMIITMGSTFAFASDKKSNSDNSAKPAATENRLSEVELRRLTNRAEEIRDMDKTNMTVKETRELKKELKGIEKSVRKGGTIVIGGASLILLIILIILLF